MGALYEEGYIPPSMQFRLREESSNDGSLAMLKQVLASGDSSLSTTIAPPASPNQPNSTVVNIGTANTVSYDKPLEELGQIVATYPYNRDAMENVVTLDSRPTWYSWQEVMLLCIVIVAWAYAVHALFKSWTWNLRPPKDPLLRRRKAIAFYKRIRKQLSSCSGTRAAVCINTNTPATSCDVAGGGLQVSQGVESSPSAIPSSIDPGKGPRTAEDFIIEREGPFAPRPRGLSRVLVVSSENETVLFEKPGRRLKEVMIQKERFNRRKFNKRFLVADLAMERSLSTGVILQPPSKIISSDTLSGTPERTPSALSDEQQVLSVDLDYSVSRSKPKQSISESNLP